MLSVLLQSLGCRGTIQTCGRHHQRKLHRSACLFEKRKATLPIESGQIAQDAQAGYARDYCNKRQPMAFSEVKECCKGHHSLAERVADQKLQGIGETTSLAMGEGKSRIRTCVPTQKVIT